MTHVVEGEAARLLAARYTDCSTKLAAREKRMREVAEEMRAEKLNEPGAPMYLRAMVCEWAAKLLEGLDAT